MPTNYPSLTLSIVSHLQIELVKKLLNDLNRNYECGIKVILTLNLIEDITFKTDDYSFPIHIIHNQSTKGFGANHNNAFEYCNTPYYAVINPDIRLNLNPFPTLVNELKAYDAALIAPQVVNTEHQIEDSVRHFPTPLSILKKIVFNKKTPDYPTDSTIVNPDWVGGMFMLFQSEKFKSIGGFDEGYFLYYEDVDICKSLHNLNETIIYSPSVTVIHAARRSSHKKLNYLLMHLKSMLRFFRKWLFSF
jgi:N-acetylglucosaminyl-diphospho-decaprenol L-rhamnosyltransferase